MDSGAAVHWLEDEPKVPTGVTWGVPWAEGELERDDALRMADDAGASVPVQSWPTAYWPDGSVKWTGHAATFSDEAADAYEVSPDEEATAPESTPDQRLSVEDADRHVEVDTGRLVCRIHKEGSSVIGLLETDESVVCTDGRLVCVRERRREDGGTNVYEEDRFEGRVDDVTLEQEGPIRAVVKIEGTHEATDGGCAWLPFTLYLTFYAGISSIEATHTFVYDGEPERDFIKGLGLSFDVPMAGPAYNRHVRFSGDEGLFREPAQVLPPRALGPDRERYERQIAGEPLDPEPGDEEWAEMVEDVTPWNGFKLVQDSPDHHVIEKTAGEDYCWVDAAHGRRSSGLGFVGDSDGGLAVGVKDFWEAEPSSLEATDVLADEARLRTWFWSPDAEAMDLRPYDEAGRDTGGAAYGGVDEELSTPRGTAKTSEFTLYCFDEVPDRDTLLDCADEARAPSLLVCDPDRYYDVGAFGRWSREDWSTPARAWIEDQLDAAVSFYRDEVEQRRWYGFWDYGDIMHSYDPTRHSWYYDIGGYAWQNTEQMPTMWFWYTFLRSGRADVFRLAEAQTRHTSEVDVYHEGPLAGLGSRHNVLHWAGGCKEPRVSMTGHHRFYYYLTGGDERLGEIFREVRDADFATLDVDPMRNHVGDDDFPTHARIAPDWLSYSANWLTEWERFESEEYREKIRTGIECIKEMPLRMFSGSTFGYDPETGELHHIGDGNYGHTFLHCMGGPQLWPELAALIDDPEWEAMLAETGELYLDEEAREARLPDRVADSLDKLPMYATNMAGFAAELHDDDELARETWDLLLYDEDRRIDLPLERETVDESYPSPMEELPGVKTNVVSIWALNVIACLEYIGDHLPEPPSE
ncbi:exo-rhamnogalacturonan lyase family protein [Halosimplex sp. J119]